MLDTFSCIVSSPSVTISRYEISSSERRRSLFEIGNQTALARRTPHSVAANADAIAGPSLPGSVSWPRTPMRPITVPRIPKVGE